MLKEVPAFEGTDIYRLTILFGVKEIPAFENGAFYDVLAEVPAFAGMTCIVWVEEIPAFAGIEMRNVILPPIG